MEKSVADKAATGRTRSCRAKRGRTMSAVRRPPSALAQGRISRKAREGAHPQLFGQMLKDKPAFCVPVKVAHPPIKDRTYQIVERCLRPVRQYPQAFARQVLVASRYLATLQKWNPQLSLLLQADVPIRVLVADFR